MRTKLFPLAGVVLLAACGDITVPDYENPPLEELLNPTVETVRAAATGVLQGTRQDTDTYVRWGGILGREGYFLDGNEDRYVRLIFAGTPSGANFTGSSYWTTPYRNIRTSNLLIAAADLVELPAAEKSAIKGFARTIQALDFIQLQNTRDKIPVQVNTSLDSLTTPPPLVASRDESWAFISNLLDQGLADLTAAGNVQLPFAMPSGLTQYGFTTTGKFAQLNRALKARVEVYRASEFKGATPDVARYQAALTALQGSFLDLTADLRTGPYQTYSPNSGDVANTLSDPSGKTVADPTLRRDAQLRANGQRDARFVAKTDSAANIATVRGLTSDLTFALYTTRPFFGAGGTASPIPMIRNEELILLRAEARWFTGDKVGAMADLNHVRTTSGGLPQIAVQPADDAAFRTALLYERRYSLMFEGAHRWVDYRRFGLLTQLHQNSAQRVGGGTDRVATWLPLPSNETLPRT